MGSARLIGAGTSSETTSFLRFKPMTSPSPGERCSAIEKTSHDWHQSLASEICTTAARARIKNAVPVKEQNSCGGNDTGGRGRLNSPLRASGGGRAMAKAKGWRGSSLARVVCRPPSFPSFGTASPINSSATKTAPATINNADTASPRAWR